MLATRNTKGFLKSFKGQKMLPSKEASNSISMVKLVWPIFVEMILTMLVGNMDQYMVSSYSQNAVAAIGNANQIMNVLLIMFEVINVATTILVSQYIGSNSKHKTKIIYTLSLSVNIIISVVISGILLLFTDSIFAFMKVPEEILADATTYIKIVGGFIFLHGIMTVFSAIFKSNKLMKNAMTVSVVVNLINLLGNALLINGIGPLPAMGVAGAAIATNLSRFGGILIYIYLFHRKIDARISLKLLKPFPKLELRKLLGVGLPSAGESFSYSMSMTFILKVINTFGTYAINTKVYAGSLVWIAYLFPAAVGQATQVVIANFMGAGETDKVDSRVMKNWRRSLIVTAAMSILLFLSSDILIGFFTDDPKVVELAKAVLFIDIFLELGRCTNIAMVRSLQATGDNRFPMMVGIISMWTFGLGVGSFLGVVCDLGLIGIWIGMAMDEFIRGIIFIIRWRKGKWKTLRLVE